MEVTEGMLYPDEEAMVHVTRTAAGLRAWLDQLHRAGRGISINDGGLGFSSGRTRARARWMNSPRRATMILILILSTIT